MKNNECENIAKYISEIQNLSWKSFIFSFYQKEKQLC